MCVRVRVRFMAAAIVPETSLSPLKGMRQSVSTSDDLRDRFKPPTVRLDDICAEFFGMDRAKAYQRANLNALPVPTFRAGSRKSPRLVHLDDLAKWLDEQRAAARSEWQRSKA